MSHAYRKAKSKKSIPNGYILPIENIVKKSDIVKRVNANKPPANHP